jgi:PIN domain nuclease of toxin-antitoxin system
MEPDEWFRAVLAVGSITPLPVTWEIALASTRLAAVHNDPADRIVIATAVAHGCRIVTSDREIAKYPEANVLW